MVMLKGMGIQNYRILFAAGIADVKTLAAQEPGALHRALQDIAAKIPGPTRIPDEAKIRVWIAAARGRVIS
jgi:hypothetical protein